MRHTWCAGAHIDFDNLRANGAKTVDNGNSHTVTLRHGFPPACRLGRRIKHCQMARLSGQKRTAVFVAVLARFMGQFVNSALNVETVLGVIDRAPCPKAHMVVTFNIMHERIRQIVNRVGCFWRIMLVHILLIPRDRHAVIIEANLEPADRCQTIPVLLGVLFARPDHFDRKIAFGSNFSCHNGEIWCRASTKSAAKELIVHGDIACLEPQRFCDSIACAQRVL